MEEFDTGVPGKRTKLYRTWTLMRNRCHNKRGKDYSYYGGRGIRICVDWDDFQVFANEVGLPPGPEWTLDRINPNGHYEPNNVRWATRKTQGRNRPYNGLSDSLVKELRELYGEWRYKKKAPNGITQAQLAKRYGVTQTTISHALTGRTWG
jgi:hypothetical protein